MMGATPRNHPAPCRAARRLALAVLALLAGTATAAGQAADKPAAAPPGLDTRIHRERAAEVMAHIREHFYDRRSGLYSAKAGGRDPELIWGAGVMFSAVVAAARHDRSYRQVLRSYFTALDAHWDLQADPPGYEPARTQGGHDKYYDDNAWLVISFLEAHRLTGDGRYLRRAGETLEFVLSGWDERAGGGIWWHEGHKDGSKNTCSNAPAAVGCLLLARVERGDKAASLNRWGDRIMVWTVDKFQAPDGLFYDSFKVATGEMNRARMSYNSALMIRGFIALHARTGEPFYLTEARRIARAAESLLDRRTGAYRDQLKWSHLLVEADLELYRWTGDRQLLERALRNADVHYAAWRRHPPDDLITQASLARELWLLADLETPAGREFWRQADRRPAPAAGR